MIRYLPVLTAAIIFSVIYLPIRREIVYQLGISGDPTTSCCKVEEISSTGNFEEGASVAVFNSQVIDYPKTSLAQMTANFLDSQVLGTLTSSGEERWVEVSLTEQKLRAWEGNRLVMEFLISSGKWAPTPKGTYHIWYKTRNQRYRGGSRALGTYYDLPNVPHNMFFYQGYGIHGAYWHNNFGTPMSHGCVNVPLDKAGPLFDWAGPVVPASVNAVRATPENPGTRVLVH